MNQIITKVNTPFTLRGRMYICKQPANHVWIPCNRCIFYKKNIKKRGEFACKLDIYYNHNIGKCCGLGGVYESYNQ